MAGERKKERMRESTSARATDGVYSSGRKRRSTTVVKSYVRLNVGEEEDDDEEEGGGSAADLDDGDDGEAGEAADTATNKKLDKTKWTQEEVRFIKIEQ